MIQHRWPAPETRIDARREETGHRHAPAKVQRTPAKVQRTKNETLNASRQSVTFALPSSIIKQVVPALITTGHYDHPTLGLALDSLDPNIANAMNLPSEQLGALVEAVNAGGPADKAGIKASSTNFTDDGEQITIGGDVITAYNGQTVKSSDDLIAFLSNSGSVGQIVTLTVLRNGQQIQVQVTLGIRPSS